MHDVGAEAIGADLFGDVADPGHPHLDRAHAHSDRAAAVVAIAMAAEHYRALMAESSEEVVDLTLHRGLEPS
jgi:hypothetical protein